MRIRNYGLLLLIMVFTQCQKPIEEPTPEPVSPGIAEFNSVEEYANYDFNLPDSVSQMAFVEILTGVRDPDAPEFLKRSKELQDSFPDNFMPIVIHPGLKSSDMCIPFAGDRDLNINWYPPNFVGVNLKNIMPIFGGNRSAIGLMISQQKILMLSTSQRPNPADVKIKVYDYDPATRTVSYTVQVHMRTDEWWENVYFSTYLIEDGIVGQQESPNGIINNYVHNNVAIDLPNEEVLFLPYPKKALGYKVIKKYQYKVPEGCDVDNARLVLFAHEQKYVLHATSTPLIP